MTPTSETGHYLKAFLGGIRRRIRFLMAAEGALSLTAACGLAFAIALGLFAAGVSGIFIRLIVWPLFLASTSLIALKYAFAPARAYRDDMRVALLAETREPLLRYRLASAAETPSRLFFAR